MIACPSCTSVLSDCWLQQSVDRRGQLRCKHCARYYVFVANELIELDEVASQGFDLLDPAHSVFKRRNLLIAADLLDPAATPTIRAVGAARREEDLAGSVNSQVSNYETLAHYDR